MSAAAAMPATKVIASAVVPPKILSVVICKIAPLPRVPNFSGSLGYRPNPSACTHEPQTEEASGRAKDDEPVRKIYGKLEIKAS